jgi:hypothetical protein
MEPTKECIQCGAVAKYREGIKNGRQWKGYFCTDPQCKHAEWLRDGKQPQRPQGTPNPGSQVNPNSLMEALTQILVVLKEIRDQGKIEVTGNNNPFPR